MTTTPDNPAFEQKEWWFDTKELEQRAFRQQLIVSIAGGLMAAPNVSGKPDQLAGYIVKLTDAIIEAEAKRDV
jgi:hypothetical protein